MRQQEPSGFYHSYLENNYCQYWIDENDILHEVFKFDFERITLDIAKTITKDRLQVSNKVTRPLYVELGRVIRMDRDADKYLSTGIAMDYLSATGILAVNEIHRLGVRIYSKINTPSIPTKVFTKKEKAILWLSAQQRNWYQN